MKDLHDGNTRHVYVRAHDEGHHDGDRGDGVQEICDVPNGLQSPGPIPHEASWRALRKPVRLPPISSARTSWSARVLST